MHSIYLDEPTRNRLQTEATLITMHYLYKPTHAFIISTFVASFVVCKDGFHWRLLSQKLGQTIKYQNIGFNIGFDLEPFSLLSPILWYFTELNLLIMYELIKFEEVKWLTLIILLILYSSKDNYFALQSSQNRAYHRKSVQSCTSTSIEYWSTIRKLNAIVSIIYF